MRIKPHKQIRVVYALNVHTIKTFHRKLEDKICGISGTLVCLFVTWLWKEPFCIAIPILRNWRLSRTVLH